MEYSKILLIMSIIVISGCVHSRQKPLPQDYLIVVGKLEADTVWSGLIEVGDKIIIPEGITLTIETGTVVRFKKKGFKQFGFGDNRIYVQKGGRLIAKGDSSNYITFTSAEKKPAPGDWHGLEFHTEDDLSILEYCKVEYAYEAIVCVLSSPNISNCVISKNDKGLCFWQRSSSIISQNKMTDNNIGVLCSSKSSPNIISNIISNNKDSGICCEKGSNVTISKNEISNNFIGIKMSMDVVANIDENIIIKNEYGIQQLTVAFAIISGNIIEENKYGIYSLRKSVLNVNINSINNNEYGIFLWERTQGLVSNNNIAKNSYGIYCGKSSHPEIKGNKIIQNKTGILCEYSSYPKINGNNIYDQKKYDIKLGENQSAEWTRNIWDEAEINKWEETGRFGLIDATGNFWGVSTTKEMDKKGFGLHIKMLYDHYKDQFCRVKEKDYARDKVDFRNWENNEIN